MDYFRGYSVDAFRLLATCSARRLIELRHDPKDGRDARYFARRWIADLRDLRAAEAKAERCECGRAAQACAGYEDREAIHADR